MRPGQAAPEFIAILNEPAISPWLASMRPGQAAPEFQALLRFRGKKGPQLQ